MKLAQLFDSIVSNTCFASGASSSDKNLLKREIPLSQGSAQIPLKKPKIGVGNTSSFTALGRPGLKGLDPQSPGLNRVEPWEDVAIEVRYIYRLTVVIKFVTFFFLILH